MSNEQNPINIELSTGATLPLRPLKAKSGNTYHAVLKSKADGTRYNPGKYGVKVAPSVVGGALPESVVVFGHKLTATKGVTQSGNTKVSFAGTVDADLPGGKRAVRLSISQLPDGNFNVSGVISRPGGGSVGTAVSSL